jgi:hypothetical protein
MLLQPAGTLATGTITLPLNTGVPDGTTVLITTTQEITSLTIALMVHLLFMVAYHFWEQGQLQQSGFISQQILGIRLTLRLSLRLAFRHS